MSLFKSLTKAVLGTVTLPVAAVADAVTLGGLYTNRDRTYTGAAASDILENLKDATTPERRA
jgi:hypothetical protein